MAREQTLRIRVSDTEMATFEALAQIERLPIGTFIRRRLMLEADQRGVFPRNLSVNSKPAATLRAAGGFAGSI